MASKLHGPVAADADYIDSILDPKDPPVIYRCKNTACRYDSEEALHVYNERRQCDETRCAKCGTWICDGIPLSKAQVLHPLPIVEKTRDELKELGFDAESAVDGVIVDG